MNLSFIIPTLNEERTLLSNLIFLKRIRKYLNAELIVVDGGSHDSTVNIAKTLSCNVYITKPSRSKQFNLGAKHASGKYLVFLHADTVLDNDAINHLKRVNKNTDGRLHPNLQLEKARTYRRLSSSLTDHTLKHNMHTSQQETHDKLEQMLHNRCQTGYVRYTSAYAHFGPLFHFSL